jgi:transcriptional regulator with XRE-family HTH domain
MVSDRRTFGEQLKRQRERRGISLQAISENTKIAASLFVGLENGDCSRWPAGIYSRSYVRAYAEAIGLNADDTVEDFAAVFSGKFSADGVDVAPVRRRAAGGLRLVLAHDSSGAVGDTARRAIMAAGDLVVAASIATVTHVLLDPALWITLGSALTYHAVGRVVSDEPLVWWAYRRARTPPAHDEHVALPSAHAPEPEEVPVRSAASTAA